MNKTICTAILLAAAPLALTACSGEQQPAEETAAPDGVAGLAIDNARLVLPPVSGNPGAVYFDIAYGGERAIAIRRVDVADAARAELHETMDQGGAMSMGEMAPLTIQPGEEVSFAPGGKHAMAFELAPGLQPGATTEVTLTIAGGDKHSFPAEVRAAGDAR